jgi:hypothetical protein
METGLFFENILENRGMQDGQGIFGKIFSMKKLSRKNFGTSLDCTIFRANR